MVLFSYATSGFFHVLFAVELGVLVPAVYSIHLNPIVDPPVQVGCQAIDVGVSENSVP